MNEQYTMGGDLGQLSSAIDWVRGHLISTPLETSKKKQIELALEEAIVNVIQHGGKASRLELTLTCHLTYGRQIEFELRDNGLAFNPLKQGGSEQGEVDVASQEPGGLGLVLMKKCVDALFYRREGDKNVLTLVKQFTDQG